MPSEIIVRPAQPKDSDTVFALAREFASSFRVDEEAFRTSFVALMAEPNAHLLIAQIEEDVLGYVLAFSHQTFYANGPVAWVEELMVDANHRRQGIGQALMQSVEVWATERNCKLLALATRRAAPFYEARGYQASAAYFRKLL